MPTPAAEAFRKAFNPREPRNPHTGEWIRSAGLDLGHLYHVSGGKKRSRTYFTTDPLKAKDIATGIGPEAKIYDVNAKGLNLKPEGKGFSTADKVGDDRKIHISAAFVDMYDHRGLHNFFHNSPLPSGLAVAQSNSPYLESKGLYHNFGVYADNPKFVQDTDEAIRMISEKFPIGKSFTGVTPLSKGSRGVLNFKGKRVAKSALVATSMGREQRIFLNDTAKSKIFENLGENDHDAMIGNMAPSTRDPFGRTVHEMGHVIAAQNRITNDQILTALLESQLVKVPPVTGKAFTPTVDDFNGSGTDLNKDSLSKLTKYAAWQLPEAFAELFAMRNRPDPWGQSTAILPQDRATFERQIELFAQSINRQKGQKLI